MKTPRPIKYILQAIAIPGVTLIAMVLVLEIWPILKAAAAALQWSDA